MIRSLVWGLLIAFAAADRSLRTIIIDSGIEERVAGCGSSKLHVVLAVIQNFLEQNVSYPGGVSLASRFHSYHLGRHSFLKSIAGDTSAAPTTNDSSYFSPWTFDSHHGDFDAGSAKKDFEQAVSSGQEIYRDPSAEIELDIVKWNFQSIQALLALTPVWLRLLRFAPHASVSQKVHDFSKMLCTIMELESSQPELRENTPVTCFLQDLSAGFAQCSVRRKLKETSSCHEFLALPKSKRIDGYPAKKCQPSPDQFRYSERSESIEPHVEQLELHYLVPTPRVIPQTYRDSELLTYLRLYESLWQIYRMAQIDFRPCQQELLNFEHISGWRVLQLLSKSYDEIVSDSPLNSSHIIPDERAAAAEAKPKLMPVAPFVLLSASNRDPCEMAIGIRGTMVRIEWVTNFHYWAVPFASTETSEGRATTVHAGLVRTVAGISGDVRSVLERHSRTHQCTCERSRIIVYGHSLGAGIATLLSFHLANHYRKLHCSIRVDGVFFSAPKTFSPNALNTFRHAVNSRQIIDLADPLKYLPCSHVKKPFPRCANSRYITRGFGADYWTDHVGLVELRANVSAIARRSSEELSMSASGQENSPDQLGLFHEWLKDGLETVTDTLERTAQAVEEGFNSWLETLPPGVSSLIKRVLEVLSPFKPPTVREIMAAHISSFGCVLSRVCRLWDISWTWLCDRVGPLTK